MITITLTLRLRALEEYVATVAAYLLMMLKYSFHLFDLSAYLIS
jgi:hypothetical protein